MVRLNAPLSCQRLAPGSNAEAGSLFKLKPANITVHSRMAYVHFGVGCDGCGEYPISGRAYRCTECPEEIGFDLCEACVSRTGKMGR